jgi:hypothetical protein
MQDLSLEETLLAKHGYEHFFAMHGIISKQYHADNGRCADKGFYDNCSKNGQVILFCSVGSYYHYGIAEQKIKDLTLGAQTLLIHAKRMLPKYIPTILWLFALKHHEDRMNNLVHCTDGQTPYQALLGLDAAPIDIKNFHTCGCPCYILDHCLQSGNLMIPKWEVSTNGFVHWSITLTCHKCVIDSKSTNRTCLSAIPHHL